MDYQVVWGEEAKENYRTLTLYLLDRAFSQKLSA
jgi:hypothetical protein